MHQHRDCPHLRRRRLQLNANDGIALSLCPKFWQRDINLTVTVSGALVTVVGGDGCGDGLSTGLSGAARWGYAVTGVRTRWCMLQ